MLETFANLNILASIKSVSMLLREFSTIFLFCIALRSSFNVSLLMYKFLNKLISCSASISTLISLTPSDINVEIEAEQLINLFKN